MTTAEIIHKAEAKSRENLGETSAHFCVGSLAAQLSCAIDALEHIHARSKESKDSALQGIHYHADYALRCIK